MQTTVAIPVDTRGQRTVKECPGCHVTLGRTAPKCGKCGHSFVRHPERLPKKPGRKPRVDIDAPATDGAIDRILAAADARREATASAVPVDGGFTPRLNGGALAIVWTRWGVEFALTPDETAAVRRALT